MKIIEVRKSPTWGWHPVVFGVSLPYPCIPTRSSQIWRCRFKGLSDNEIRIIVEGQYKEMLGIEPNFDHPQTFSEKLCWLKINYHNPLMTVCADKVQAREYFIGHFPGRHDLLVKQIAVCDNWEDLDFRIFPKKFVLKSNWGSGAQIIVSDKCKFNPSSVKGKVKRWTNKKSNHYYNFFEWGYKDILPKIIVEEFLDYEYKMEFFCFNGKPKFFWVVLNDKTTETKANMYWLDFSQIPVRNHYPNFYTPIEWPDFYDELVGCAEKLAGKFPFVRCDFYITKTGYKFSELTFFHWAGYSDFSPAIWDLRFGDFIELPKQM